MNTEPSTPRDDISPELLKQYLRGELDPAGEHRVEQAMDADPLLREAAEGLSMPGALAAAEALRAPQPSHWPARLLGGGIVAVVVVLGVLVLRMPDSAREVVLPGSTPVATPEADRPVAADGSAATLPIDGRDSVPAVAPGVAMVQAEAFREPTPVQVVPREPAPDRIEPVPARIGDRPVDPAQPTSHTDRSSRRLVFRHGLKLVHPSELYGLRVEGPRIGGQRARVGSADPQPVDRLATDAQPAPIPYLDHMGDVLAAFAAGRWQRAQEGTQVVLDQYPEDVNAQFYNGLAAYEQGQDVKARRWLGAAERNTVNSFQEEAAWYGALVVERTEGAEAARPLFERIARTGGFYAERARGRK